MATTKQPRFKSPEVERAGTLRARSLSHPPLVKIPSVDHCFIPYNWNSSLRIGDSYVG